MNADFLDAHERHRVDAEQLFQAQRWANSDHLYGMAAECGLKVLMLKFGMPYNHSNDVPKNWEDKKHVDEIWSRFEIYSQGHAQGVNYALPGNNPFDNWKAAQRYANQSNFDEASAETHKNGFVIVHELIKKAKRDGLL